MLRKRYPLICLFIGCIVVGGYGQNSKEGFNFHALILNSFGKVVPNKNVDVKINFYTDSLKTVLAYGEKHSTKTNEFGLFNIIVGQGITTNGGIYSTYADINWSSGKYFLNVQMDTTGTASSYIDIGTTKMVSVPYCLYSETTSTPFNSYPLNDLSDIDTSGIKPFYILKWSNSSWKPSKDMFNDTLKYAYLSHYVVHSDTAKYALFSKSSVKSDTAFYTKFSDTAKYSKQTLNAKAVKHAIYSDSATYAISSTPAWKIIGNLVTGNSFLGSKDSVNFILKTRNQSRIFISTLGSIGINNSSPQSALHIISNEIFIAQGTSGTSVSSAPSGQGTRMIWDPSKGAFRAGFVNSSNWNNDSLGNYSFATGYNNKVSGKSTDGGNYSAAFGSNNVVAAGGSIALGADNKITQNNLTLYGSSLAMGINNLLTDKRQVALGESNIVSAGSSTTIGKNNTNSGANNIVIGYKSIAKNGVSTAIGYYANAGTLGGNFVFSDASSSSYTNSLVFYDFIVRASGGVIFYTDPNTTMGVYLASGSGSWSSISDRNKKENFLSVDDEESMLKISQLQIKKWKYKTDKEAFHIGVLAQDMYEKFHLGESPESITMTDMDGVILSCIKALYKKTDLLSNVYTDLGEITAESASMAADLKELDRRLILMEEKLKHK